MGTIKKGILGGFSGTVGTVVGGSWKGIAYMRGHAQSISNPRTEAQVAQRTKLNFIVKALKPFENIINLGFKSGKGSPMNAAVSYNIKNAVAGTSPNFTLDYEKLSICTGSLPAVVGASTPQRSGTSIVIDYESFGGNSTDVAIAVGINKTTGEVAITDSDDNTRDVASTVLTIPSSWSGKAVACYIVFRTADRRQASNSFYAGSVS